VEGEVPLKSSEEEEKPNVNKNIFSSNYQQLMAR
jgi:hypothetical protein